MPHPTSVCPPTPPPPVLSPQHSSPHLSFDGTHDYTYDIFNRLITVWNSDESATIASYAYDALGRRITENPTGGTTIEVYYSANWQALEDDQSSHAKNQYVWSPVYIDALIERDRDADNDGSHTLEERLYAQQDANFNLTAILNTSGSVQERYLFDPYGSRTVTDSSFTARSGNASSYDWKYGHQGLKHDSETGLIYGRNRMSSPFLGRWIQAEPMGATYIDTANLFEFERALPTKHLDPYGLCVCGADITQDLKDIYNDVATKWDALPTVGTQKLVYTNANKLRGWDIYELAFNKGIFSQAGCGDRDCKNTVTVLGRCYPAEEVNYFLWGVINRFYADQAYRDARVPPHFVLDDAIDIANSYRYGAGWMLSGGADGDFGGAGFNTSGRDAWIRAGFALDLGGATSSAISPTRCKACTHANDKPISWHLGADDKKLPQISGEIHFLLPHKSVMKAL